MNIELFKDGILVMIIGMGFVYFFIFIMIYAMELCSQAVNFINKIWPEEENEEKYVSKKKATNNNDMEIALAITCAIMERSKTC